MSRTANTDGEVVALPTKEEVLKNETSLLAGMLKAANYRTENTTPVQIKRGDEILFNFRVHPLSEDDMQECRRKATKTIVNPAGRHLPRIDGDVDVVGLRCYKIYAATVPEDQANVWNNPDIKKALNALHANDVIESVLMGGEKDAICDLIDEISGYGTAAITLEDYAKN